MKKYIHFLTIILILGSCTTLKKEGISQNEKPEEYRISHYIINTSEKKIYIEGMVGGSKVQSDGSVMHWDGYSITQAKSINYKKTKLIIFGKYMINFKENFNIKENLSGIRFLYGTDYFTDGKKIYEECYGKIEEKINISKYTPVNDFLYERKGKLYTFPVMYSNPEELEEITGLENFDVSSATYIHSGYFTTKDGLYWLNGDTSLQLEKYEEGNNNLTLYSNYFTYNNSVYKYSDYRPEKLDLDARKTKKIVWAHNNSGNWTSMLLSDGINTYKGSETGSFHLIDTTRIKIPENILEWIPVASLGMSFIEKEGDLYFFEDVYKHKYVYLKDFLVWVNNGFYKVNISNFEMEPIGNIWIRNYDTKEYEILDPTQYTLYKNSFVYKGIFYFDYKPVVNDIDIDKLEYFSYNGNTSDYLTDGKYLLYTNICSINNNFSYSEGKEPNTLQLSIPQPDFNTLSVINEEILIDKNYIYNGKDQIVLPRNKLGFPVIVYN